MVIKFDIVNFPKFTDAHFKDGYASWVESLHEAGYHSAAECVPKSSFIKEMNEKEFTMFALKWS